ncbi:MAG: carboxypeptidase regulatory-like domain-containing protein, partial [Verrucomicrobiota bacterium]
MEVGTTPGTFTSHAQNQTYVKFTGLSGSSQTMTVTGVSGGESGVAAIQIVQTSASTYSILPSAGAHGSISPSTLQTVNSGSDSTFTITPDAGYVIYQVLVDGTNNPAAVTSGTYTFTNVSDDHTITASFISETTDLHLQVDLQASSLALGSNLGSWPNAGLLGGSFDKYSGGTGPDVVTILGKKAVQFVQPDSTGNSRRTLASAIPAPASLSGNNPWTISTLLYRSSSQPGGENSYAQWSGGSYSTGQSAIFRYTANGAYIHWSSDSGFQTVPSADAWHNVTITFDGATETIYVDGVVDRTDARTLDILPGGLMIIGGRTYHDLRGEDQYWRFNGAIASLKIYDRALSASEVQALVTVPTQTITASAGAGGTISPSGASIINQGDSPTFTIAPNVGYAISDVLVDGVSVGAVASYTFTNVTTAHTIAASFTALPPQLVSGKVTDGSTGILGATVYFKLSAPAYLNPLYTTTTTNAAGDFAISLPPGTWHVTASKDGYDYATDSTFSVASSPVVLPNIVLVANPNWDVLFTLNTDELLGLANGDRINTWGGLTAMTTYNNGQPLLGPVVETIGTNNWELNTRAPYDGSASPIVHDRGDGFVLGQYTNAIPVNGASVVTIIKPIRKVLTPPPGWTSIVDIFYDRLVLGIKTETGELVIWRNGSLFNSGVSIPDGQTTILSLVVQPTGEYKVWANGLQVIDRTTTSDMSALVPGSDSYKKFINVGRNNPDTWTTFNGNIGDVYVFKRAIPDSKRTALQNALSAKFATPIPVYTTISGKVTLPDGITPVAGATVSAVGTSLTFTNLTAIDGTYSVMVEGNANYSVSATAESFTASTPVNVPVGGTAVTGINLTITPINAIQGVVKTVSGTPIYNAVVQVGGPGYPAAVTDLNGHYLVTGIQAIEGLEVYADALGFADNTQYIDGTPAASGVITLDITLTSKAEAGVVINGGLEAW